MSHFLYKFRERFHPLNHMRRHRLGRKLLHAIDLPIWTTLTGVDRKVRVRLIRHASTFLLRGGAEPAIHALFSAIHKDLGIRSFWDVGANVGYYTWLIKSLSPASEIRMFEPDDDNAALVRQTLRTSTSDGIVLRQVAVSDTHGRSFFVRDEVSGSTGGIRATLGNFSEEQWGVSGSTAIVDTITLDSERTKERSIDLIKIDVEGHEEAVIRGGKKIIEVDQPVIVFECFHGGREIAAFLSRIGYWLGNAESMSDDFQTATNFCALPARHRMALGRLRKTWSLEMDRLGALGSTKKS